MLSFIISVGMHIACHCNQAEAEDAAATLTNAEIRQGFKVFGVDDAGVIVLEITPDGAYVPMFGEELC